MAGKQFTDLTKASALKDSDIIAVHDGNGLKKGLLSQLSNYMGTKFNNPNLLINPDFKINQRGQAVYNTEPKNMYTLDRWCIYMPTGGSVKPNLNGTITVTNNSNDQGWFFQELESKIENVVFTANVISVSGIVNIYADDAGKTITNTGITSLQSESAKKCGFVLTANSSITLKWVKLEQGSIATPFVAPNPAEELMRCERYFQKRINMFTFIGSTNAFSYATHFSEMRIKPTISTIENYKNNVNSYQSRVDDIFNGYYIDTIINSVNGAFVLLKLKFELDAELY